MTKETITLIAALLAAVTSAGNVYFNYLSATSLERARWQKAREDESRKNLRLALAEYTRELATAVQRATWLLWSAQNSPSFAEKDLSTYDDEMREILPRLLTSRVMLAAHDTAAYERVADLSSRLYTLDASIAVAGQQFRLSPAQGLQSLQSLHDEAQELHSSLAGELAKVVAVPG